MPSTELALATEIASFDLRDGRVERMIASLPRMTDEQVIDTMRAAAHMEQAVYLIRGACVREFERRYAVRALKGGRGKRDVKGIGRRAMLSKVAAKLGVQIDTLLTDARIYETFVEGETVRVDADPFPRQVLVNALAAGEKAPDAVRLYAEKREQPGYSVARHRADVASMRQVTPMQKSADRDTLTIRLSPEARRALEYLCMQKRADVDAVVEAAILQARNELDREW